MNHTDHVRLLRDGIASPGGNWADFGSGSGAFTLALADLLKSYGDIYSIDQDSGALREQEWEMHLRFPTRQVHYARADFTQRLVLPILDGIVMASALHFQRDANKDRALGQILDYYVLVEDSFSLNTTSIAATCGSRTPCLTKPGKPLLHVTIFWIHIC